MSDKVTPISDDLGEGGSGPGYRQSPRSLEIEQALLGAILVNNLAADKVREFLLPEHFFEPVHGRIYDAILKLLDRSQTADPAKLRPYFEKDEGLEDVGGTSYLVRLAASAATIINAEDYGRTIYDLALRRELITIGEDMVLTAFDSPIDHSASDQIEAAEGQLFDLSERGAFEGGFKAFSRSLSEAVDNIQAAYQDPGHLSGITTGLTSINNLIGGLHKSDLVILAGRPSMGKTALATNMAFNAALRYYEDKIAGKDMTQSKGAVVAFFSLEMSSDQLASRILAERSGIPSSKMRTGKLNEEQFRSIARAAQELEDVPLYIDDTPALTIAQIKTRARRLKRQHGVSLVVVDYLQLVRGTGRGTAGDNRVQEISEISRGLKNLAKDLDLPVLALSQLSRAVEARDNKRPLLSDLRESGSIEQDADMVLFVYREEYYKERDKPKESDAAFDKWQEEADEIFGRAEIIVSKHHRHS